MNITAQCVRWIWSLWFLGWLVAGIKAKKTVRRESLGSILKQRVFLLPGYLLLFVPFTAWGLGTPWVAPGTWSEDGGLALCVLGLAYSVWARVALGSNWSGLVTLKEGHQLIQNGAYAYSRHPIYTGLLCASLGVALEEGALRGLLGFALIVVAFHLKAGMEERFMREQFGQDYADYASKVKRLIPFVY